MKRFYPRQFTLSGAICIDYKRLMTPDAQIYLLLAMEGFSVNTPTALNGFNQNAEWAVSSADQTHLRIILAKGRRISE
jgi:hypothetical protein